MIDARQSLHLLPEFFGEPQIVFVVALRGEENLDHHLAGDQLFIPRGGDQGSLRRAPTLSRPGTGLSTVVPGNDPAPSAWPVRRLWRLQKRPDLSPCSSPYDVRSRHNCYHLAAFIPFAFFSSPGW